LKKKRPGDAGAKKFKKNWVKTGSYSKTQNKNASGEKETILLPGPSER